MIAANQAAHGMVTRQAAPRLILGIQLLGINAYPGLCEAEYDRREENDLSTLRTFQVGRTVGPFAERFDPQLAIRAEPCHCDVGGVLLFEFFLLCLNTGIPLRVKCFGIDFCHDE